MTTRYQLARQGRTASPALHTPATADLDRLIEATVAADRAGGVALLAKAAIVLEARQTLADGQWGAYLSQTGQHERAAQRLVNVAQRASADVRFAEQVRTGWLSFSVAAIAASADDATLANLLAQPTPPTKAEAAAALRTPEPEPISPGVLDRLYAAGAVISAVGRAWSISIPSEPEVVVSSDREAAQLLFERSVPELYAARLLTAAGWRIEHVSAADARLFPPDSTEPYELTEMDASSWMAIATACRDRGYVFHLGEMDAVIFRCALAAAPDPADLAPPDPTPVSGALQLAPSVTLAHVVGVPGVLVSAPEETPELPGETLDMVTLPDAVYTEAIRALRDRGYRIARELSAERLAFTLTDGSAVVLDGMTRTAWAAILPMLDNYTAAGRPLNATAWERFGMFQHGVTVTIRTPGEPAIVTAPVAAPAAPTPNPTPVADGTFVQWLEGVASAAIQALARGVSLPLQLHAARLLVVIREFNCGVDPQTAEDCQLIYRQLATEHPDFELAWDQLEGAADASAFTDAVYTALTGLLRQREQGESWQ